ncbi:hypothetical protein Tco_1155125 [Tanacetum coccineum]
MESSNSNSKERELQLTQRLAKQRHSICMTWFEQLETHLYDLYLLNSPYAVDAFKPAFRSFFGEEHQTFKLKMFHNLDQLRLQLERENLHGVNAKTCLQALRTQFKEFLASKGVNATDLLNQGWQQDFEYFTRCESSAYRRELLENLDTLEAVIHRVVNTYGVLRMKENELNALKENGSQLHDEILHEHQIKSSVKMQSQDIQINPVQAMDDNLIVSKSSLIESENHNAFSKSEIETQMQRQEEKVNMREAVDAGLVVTESNIGPVNDEEPLAEVQLTALHNILANEQQHTEQSEPSYDTHLLETIDSNTTPTSTNMCHRGGEIDQDALLKTELLKTKDMVDKEIYNELSKRFLQLEKHCISLEIQIQQKEESFQSNKPCKNQEFPEFREFFVINDLKAQLLARTTLICNLKKQIKSVKETSNEAKVKNNIDVIETINIELEHSVAKLLAANEQLHKENEHLKQTYKELFDSIKKTKVQNKDNSESLISQINQKSVENADLKAQLQEKVFANAALKNELRKIKGNSVDTKFAKASILGKPPLQPSRNHLVVRQPNAFTSERPRISRPRFASQVDEKNDLSKTVTPHYLPKVRESAAAKPHQVNAPNYSRNSHKESYGSNDMVHAYFLEDARKMTQDKTRIPNHRDMASTRAHCTPNVCTPKPRNIYRSSPVSKTKVSLNKSSAMHEKPQTPRSCLRWNPTGRIFKTVSLRWIPIGKMFNDSTTKVDSEPPNGSNDDITNPYECNQTLYFSAGTSNSSAGKSISLTKAEEEVVAREVHATHARIVYESEPEPTQRRQSGIAFIDSFIVSKKRSSDSSKKLKGIQTLTPAEQEAADIMKALKESKKMRKRQKPYLVSWDLSNCEFDWSCSFRNASLALIQPFCHESGTWLEELTNHDPVSETSPKLPDSSRQGERPIDQAHKIRQLDPLLNLKMIHQRNHQTVTSTPPVIAPFTEFSYPKPSSLVTPPPINTEATTITPSLPEITPFIALQLREQNLDDALLRFLNDTNCILTREIHLRCWSQVPSRIKNLKESIRDYQNKREQVQVKTTKKESHDSDDEEDDDDDEGPSAGSNQGKSIKRRRHDSGASGSDQPPTKDDEQSLKTPRKSDASASKQHPALPSIGWKITDTRDADVDSSMHRSDPESEQSEQSSDNISMQDEGHASDLGGH